MMMGSHSFYRCHFTVCHSGSSLPILEDQQQYQFSAKTLNYSRRHGGGHKYIAGFCPLCEIIAKLFTDRSIVDSGLLVVSATDGRQKNASRKNEDWMRT